MPPSAASALVTDKNTAPRACMATSGGRSTGNGSARGASAAGGRGWRRGGAGRRRLVALGAAARALLHRELEREVADVDLVALFQDLRRRNPLAVDEGAVGRLEIDDDELAVAQHDARVTLGDVALRQDDVVALDAPDRDLV